MKCTLKKLSLFGCVFMDLTGERKLAPDSDNHASFQSSAHNVHYLYEAGTTTGLPDQLCPYRKTKN